MTYRREDLAERLDMIGTVPFVSAFFLESLWEILFSDNVHRKIRNGVGVGNVPSL
jgi:hypothetical protein